MTARLTASTSFTNRSKTLYIGVTNNLERRMWEQKHGTGSEFATRYKLDRLVCYESFDDARNAIAREKRLKGLLRIKKIALVVPVNPAWTISARNRLRDTGINLKRLHRSFGCARSLAPPQDDHFMDGLSERQR